MSQFAAMNVELDWKMQELFRYGETGKINWFFGINEKSNTVPFWSVHLAILQNGGQGWSVFIPIHMTPVVHELDTITTLVKCEFC
jgi:hypothetical protein